MMTKSRSRGVARTKVLLALPALVILVVLFAARSYSYTGALADNTRVFMTQQEGQGNQPQDQKEKAQKEKELKQLQAEKAQKEKELQQKQKEKAEYEKQKQEKQVKYLAPVPKDPPYAVVEKMPSYKGGQEAMFKYLQTSIQYPEEAKKKGIRGKVIVTFTVRKDGSIADVRILRGIGHGCDEEALRVVKAMPAWEPGENHGMQVDVIFNLPIKFELDSDKKETPKK